MEGIFFGIFGLLGDLFLCFIRSYLLDCTSLPEPFKSFSKAI